MLNHKGIPTFLSKGIQDQGKMNSPIFHKTAREGAIS